MFCRILLLLADQCGVFSELSIRFSSRELDAGVLPCFFAATLPLGSFSRYRWAMVSFLV